MNKIEDLIIDALQTDDYKLRIRFLVAGLMSCESNDTPEKIKKNNEWLHDIIAFIDSYHNDDQEINAFLCKISESINSYLNYSPES